MVERSGKKRLLHRSLGEIQTTPDRNEDQKIKIRVSKVGVKEVLKYVTLHRVSHYWKSSLKAVPCRWYLTLSECKQNCCPAVNTFS